LLVIVIPIAEAPAAPFVFLLLIPIAEASGRPLGHFAVLASPGRPHAPASRALGLIAVEASRSAGSVIVLVIFVVIAVASHAGPTRASTLAFFAVIVAAEAPAGAHALLLIAAGGQGDDVDQEALPVDFHDGSLASLHSGSPSAGALAVTVLGLIPVALGSSSAPTAALIFLVIPVSAMEAAAPSAAFAPAFAIPATHPGSSRWAVAPSVIVLGRCGGRQGQHGQHRHRER
jgi:hypothetical protein